MKKYKLIVLMLFLLLLPYKVNALNLTPSVDNSEKIYDYADLLTDQEENALYYRVSEFIENYNMDMVIVTISHNPYGVSEYNTKAYAEDFYDYNNFGVGLTKDGILLIVDMSNRYVYMSTTGEAILVYDDDRIDYIIDDIYLYLASGNYYQAFNSFINKTSNYGNIGIPESNKNYCIDSNGDYYNCKPKTFSIKWGIALVCAILGSVIALIVEITKYKGIKLATNANSYLKNINVVSNIDQFLTTFTSRVKISHDSGGSGSSRSSSRGGSSVSRGSSGRSHGGGGRHF